MVRVFTPLSNARLEELSKKLNKIGTSKGKPTTMTTLDPTMEEQKEEETEEPKEVGQN